MQTLIEAVRSTGASQLVIVTTLPSRAAFGGIGPAHRRDDANVILSLPPPRRTGRSDRDWRRQLGSLADRAPVITAGWGLEPASDSEGCAAIPGDPSAAEAVVKANLTYFDTRKILGPPQFSSPGG